MVTAVTVTSARVFFAMRACKFAVFCSFYYIFF